MQKCYANQKDGGLCVQRQGKVLSEEDFSDLHSLPDRDVCRWKIGHTCGHAQNDGPDEPSDSQVELWKEMYPATYELKEKIEKKELEKKEKNTFDSFFD